MKLLTASVLTLLALAPTLANAETFQCAFTEPFYTVSYETSTQVMSVTDLVTNKTKSIAHVRFQISGSNAFSLVATDKTVLAQIVLDHRGSDGMSSDVYPYSMTTKVINGPNSGVGGCESELLPVQRDPNG